MIYSYKKVVIPGRDGTTYDFVESQDDDNKTTFLGEVNGIYYRYAPDTAVLNEQPKEIEFTKVPAENITPELKSALRETPEVQSLKMTARRLIDMQVGDVYDLIADAYKLSEFALITSAYYWAEKARYLSPDEETVTTYGARGLALLKAVQDGSLMLRASFEDPDDMMAWISKKYSTTQHITNNEYINKLKIMGIY